MSELINNREKRQQMLKEVILELHKGKSVEEVKQKFKNVIDGITHTELSQIEQKLINEGLDVKEVQRLCDVHAAVFKEFLEQIQKPETIPGHPVHTLKEENRAIEKLIDEKIKSGIQLLKDKGGKDTAYKLLEDVNLLMDIDKHYKKKELLIFPYLEKYGITGPPSVMWGVDDEIRAKLKDVRELLLSYNDGKKDVIITKINDAMTAINEMIFKEENILLPMALETLTEDEWANILDDTDEIGYCLIEVNNVWKPEKRVNVESKQGNKLADETSSGHIKFETGIMSPKEVSILFDNLPFDITFVDKDDVVRYFSNGRKRIFPRAKSVIGRKIQHCHPPASVYVVEQLLSDFKAGKKDHEDFWIKMGDKYVYIRYFAVRDESGNYVGTVEVTQDIAPIQNITGEKRLLS